MNKKERFISDDKDIATRELIRGYITYDTLRTKIIGSLILCNSMSERLKKTMICLVEFDENYCEEMEAEIYQWFIISYEAAQFLLNWSEELVFYDEELDIYVLGVKFYGVSWANVFTSISVNL